MHFSLSLSPSLCLPDNPALPVLVDQPALQVDHGAALGEDLAGPLQDQAGHQDPQLDGEAELLPHAHLTLVTPAVSLPH